MTIGRQPSAQTIDERRDDPGDHAPAPGGRKREEVLDHAPKLAGVGCFCIGTNQVDLKAAQDLIGTTKRAP